MEGSQIVAAIKVCMFWLSPVIFVEGLLLLFSVEKYNSLENILRKEIGGFRKKKKSKLEVEYYGFHEWLLKRRIVVSFICIVYSAVVFLRLLENLYRKF